MSLDVPIVGKRGLSGEDYFDDLFGDDETDPGPSVTKSWNDEDDDEHATWSEVRERLEERGNVYWQKRRLRTQLTDDVQNDTQNQIIRRLEDRDIWRVACYARLRDRHTKQRTELKRRIALRDEQIEERDRCIAEHENSIHRLEDQIASPAEHDERSNTQLAMLAELTHLQKLLITTLEERLAARDEQPTAIFWQPSFGSRNNFGPTDEEANPNTTSTNEQPAARATRILPTRFPLPAKARRLRQPHTIHHTGIYCDGPICLAKEPVYIEGVRYKCTVCDNLDFCADCKADPENPHDRSHPLLKYTTHLDQPWPLRPRTVWSSPARRLLRMQR